MNRSSSTYLERPSSRRTSKSVRKSAWEWDMALAKAAAATGKVAEGEECRHLLLSPPLPSPNPWNWEKVKGVKGNQLI
jgi:hypothetical protein